MTLDRLRLRARALMPDRVAYYSYEGEDNGREEWVKRWTAPAKIRRPGGQWPLAEPDPDSSGELVYYETYTVAIPAEYDVDAGARLGAFVVESAGLDPRLEQSGLWFLVQATDLGSYTVTRSYPTRLMAIPSDVDLSDGPEPEPEISNLFTAATANFEHDTRGWTNATRSTANAWDGSYAITLDSGGRGSTLQKAQLPSLSGMSPGDDVTLSFYMRAASNSWPTTVVGIEGGPTLDLAAVPSAPNTWERFEYPLTVADIAGNVLTFLCGGSGPRVDAFMLNIGTTAEPYQDPDNEDD